MPKPGLWDRVRNVFTNEMTSEVETRRDEREHVTVELNRQLLEVARDVQKEWQWDLIQKVVHPGQASETYRSYIEGLSAMQHHIAEFNPQIEATLDPARVLAAAEQATEPIRERRKARVELGYTESLGELTGSFESVRANSPDAGLSEQREMMRQVAIRHSQAIRSNSGDRGSGLERIEHPDIETGRRRAIRDWTHEWNQQLKSEMAQEQARLSPTVLIDALKKQEEMIRQEWRIDVQTGHMERHALDSYFAGRIDQHNTLIEMAVAHPALRETLPHPIAFEQMREQLREQLRQGERTNHAVGELARQEARYIEQMGNREGFGVRV